MLSAIDITRDLIAIPSVNPMGSGHRGSIYTEKGIAEYCQSFFRRLGIDVCLSGKDPDHPNVIARLDCGKAETILLEAHMDTVSHENMIIPPFDPVISDGKLFGRGSCDTKASLASYLHAISVAVAQGRRFTRNVIAVGVHDEEYSFGGSRECVENGLHATFAIAGEPTSLNIIYSHKGICRFHLHTSGISAHAALPWLGDSAIYRMADVILEIREHGEELKKHIHPDLGCATINVGRINGGKSVNIVPPECSIEIDRRLLPGETFRTVTDLLLPRLSKFASHVRIDKPYLEAVGVYTDKTSVACTSLRDACHRAQWQPEFQTAHYGTDASIFSQASIPTVVFGPGSVAHAHTEAEYVPIKEIEQASEIILALLTE